MAELDATRQELDQQEQELEAIDAQPDAAPEDAEPQA